MGPIPRFPSALLAALAALAAAGPFLPGMDLAVPEAAAAQKVTFTLDFEYAGRHAYYFVAQEKGFYRDAGLDVEIVRGSGSADAIRAVGAGRAPLGFADAATLVVSRTSHGLPVKVVALVYTRAPHCIFCLEEAGVRAPKDLEGKKIATPPGSASTTMFPAFVRATGINADRVTRVAVDTSALAAVLASRQVDCVSLFYVAQPLLERRLAPKKITRLLYADAGLEFYSNGIIVGDSFLKEHPDVVRRFVAATVRGMEAAFADPAEAGRIMNKYHPQIEPALGQAETEIVRELAVTPLTRAHGLGYIDPKKIEQTRDVVAEAFNLARRIPVEELYAPGFAGK
ncbi:MAG TPA: ABC transporter substrate-binding protein [Candidatus Methylomirabilis sp.]